MNDVKDRLMELKEVIDNAGTKLAELEGRRKEILRRLKDEHNADDARAAKKIQREARKTAEALGEELEGVVAGIEAQLEEMRA